MNGVITIEKVQTFLPMFGRWLRWGWVYLAGLVVGLFAFQHFFMVGVNASKSLEQYTVFLVLKWDKNIHRGDLVAFENTADNPYQNTMLWVKRAAGVEGDEVSVAGREFFVNGAYMGTAMTHGQRGKLFGRELELGPTGVIPAGFIYVQADHKESLDSRYALMGWVPRERIKGRAVVIF